MNIEIEAFIPKENEPDLKSLLNWEGNTRRCNASDEGKTGLKALIVAYQGNGPRRCFKGFAMAFVEVGKVGATYADVWIKSIFVKHGGSNDAGVFPSVGPARYAIEGGRFYILVESGKAASAQDKQSAKVRGKKTKI